MHQIDPQAQCEEGTVTKQLILYLNLLTMLVASAPAWGEEYVYTSPDPLPDALRNPEGVRAAKAAIFPDAPLASVIPESLTSTRLFPGYYNDASVTDAGMASIGHGVSFHYCVQLEQVDNTWFLDAKMRVEEGLLADDLHPTFTLIEDVLTQVPCSSEPVAVSTLSDILLLKGTLHHYNKDSAAAQAAFRDALTVYPPRQADPSWPAWLPPEPQVDFNTAFASVLADRGNGGLGTLTIHGTFANLTVGGGGAEDAPLVAGLHLIQFTDAQEQWQTRLMRVTQTTHPRVTFFDHATWFEVMLLGEESNAENWRHIRDATYAHNYDAGRKTFAVVSYEERIGVRYTFQNGAWTSQVVSDLASILPDPSRTEPKDDSATEPRRPLQERRSFVAVDSPPGEMHLVAAGLFHLISPHPHGGGGIDGRLHINNGFSVDVGVRASARSVTVEQRTGTLLLFRVHAGASMRFHVASLPLEPIAAIRAPFHFEGRETFAVRPGFMGGGGLRVLPKNEGPVSFEILGLAGGVAIGSVSQALVDIEARAVFVLPAPSRP